MIELRALGGLQLRDSADGREILSVLARTKPPGVLVYLALSPADVSHSRDKLLELLWPDSSTEKGRNSLSQALHILRRGLGPGVIGTTEDDELFLEADSVWCDVAAFDEALAAGHEREALELYGGHLWDGSDEIRSSEGGNRTRVRGICPRLSGSGDRCGGGGWSGAAVRRELVKIAPGPFLEFIGAKE